MALGLALAAVLPYARVVGHDFVFDDYSRVIENPHVAFGLSWAGLVRLTTLFHASNWHPLTWFSHMVDFELYGSDPAGHHLTSVLLHACNTVLLFVTLTRMTGEAACAALVALLFAVHPLNVETVAWVSERKGVLSTTFWLFSLLAYERYARRRRAGRYLLVAISMALGLTAKGTLVTIPFVLLLLDWWPLRRWPLLEQDAATADGSPLPAGAGAALAIARRRLVLEKLPLLGLSVVGSVLTLVAQQAGGAVQAVATVSLTARLDNTLLAYVQYLVQALWPVRLACFYPHPTIVGESTSGELSLAAIGAAALLAAMTLAAARARSRPYILVGWLWYLGTLIPVVGLVQVGAQAMADRYTYVPMIGIYVALVWGARDAIARWPRSGPVLVTAAAMAVLLCVRLTWTQVGTWKTSVTLYEHALRVTRHNYLAHNNLGNAYLRAGNTEQAEAQLRRALDILPTLASAHNNLGVILLGRGDLTGAEDHFRRALEIDPEFADARSNVGAVAMQRGDPAGALAHLERAMQARPESAEALTNLGIALVRLGRLSEAAAQFTAALRVRPDYVDAHNGLGLVRLRLGDPAAARAHFERTLEVRPKDAAALRGLEQAKAMLAGARPPQDPGTPALRDLP